MIATLDPVAIPVLRIAGAIFLILHFLAAGYVFRHRRRLFDRDPDVLRDFEAVRHVRVEAILFPWLFIGTAVFILWLGLWSS